MCSRSIGAAPLNGSEQSLRQLGSLMVLGGVIGVLAAAFVGAFLARKALEPIDRITQTASEIARGGDLQRRITKPGPPDEVGRLTETFNVMLDRLEGMFKAQQRFTADISHELRTPLTTIRGNADLLQRMGGADKASIDAIRSETDRMIRLVGDLLLLAQADAGLPIRREPVAIDRLANEVVRQLPELRQIDRGIIHLFIQHTSASLAINENADPSVRDDFESHFDVLADAGNGVITQDFLDNETETLCGMATDWETRQLHGTAAPASAVLTSGSRANSDR